VPRQRGRHRMGRGGLAPFPLKNNGHGRPARGSIGWC
jgi:hypothetical protein